MKRLLVVALIVTPCVLLAGTDIKINAKRLPKGMSVSRARSLVTKSSAAANAVARARMKAEKAKLKRAWDKLGAVREAMKKQEQTNSEYGSFMRRAQSLMKSKSNNRLNRVLDLLKKNRDVVDRTYHFGGADKDKIKDLLKNIYGLDFSYVDLISMQLRKLLEQAVEPALPATLTFNPPYAFHTSDLEKSGAGFNNASVTFTNNSGRMRLSCDSLATGLPASAECEATEGVLFTVPANAHRMTITLHNNFSFRTTTTAVGGAAFAIASGTFRVHLAGNRLASFAGQSLFSENNNAIVVGGQELSIPSESRDVTLTLEVSPGQNFEAAVDIDVQTNAQGLSGGAASIDFTASSIEVTFEE